MTETLSKEIAASSSSQYTAATQSGRPSIFLFTGGGTGGHVYPGLAIADEVRHRHPDARIIYVGARGKIEERLVPKRGYPLYLVRASGLPTQKRLLPLLAFALNTGLGVLQSLALLLRIRPHVVVATGGYASSPVLLALAALRRLHLSSAYCFVHEQNVAPGLVNRLAGRIADRIGVSFSDTLRYFPSGTAVHVGYPVRREIATITREDARTALDIPADARVIFAFGGSQGARSINRGLVDTLPRLLARDRVHVIHVIGLQSGSEYHAADDTASRIAALGLEPDQRSRYHQMGYTHHIEMMYAASDIVIGRAAAGTVTEICACGRPSILIPLPNAPGDHQAMNGITLESAGAALVLYEEAILDHARVIGAVDGQRLADMILSLLDDTPRRTAMAERASRLFDRHGLDRIMTQIDPTASRLSGNNGADSSDHSDHETLIPATHHAGASFEVIEAIARLSPFELLKKIEQADQAFIDKIGPDYLKYRIDGYLMSSRWQVRNVGVKLVGRLACRDKLSRLLAMLKDRTPAPWLQRLCGGDYVQVGFIRRNIIRTIGQLGVFNPDVREALLDALSDPYFEVRSAAATTIAGLAHQIGRDEAINAVLRHRIQDASFEVTAAAIGALGKIGDGSFIPDIRPFYLATNWKIREAIINALMDLIQRDLITDYESLGRESEHILVTCVGFQPTFPIKRRLNELIILIKQRRQQDTKCSTTSASTSSRP